MGNKILEAARCAHYFHEGQVRNTNDEPYYFHCARVAAIASSFADSVQKKERLFPVSTLSIKRQ